MKSPNVLISDMVTLVEILTNRETKLTKAGITYGISRALKAELVGWRAGEVFGKMIKAYKLGKDGIKKKADEEKKLKESATKKDVMEKNEVSPQALSLNPKN